MKQPAKVHNVLLAVNEADAGATIRRNPHMANWSVITRESQLYGLWIGEWAITEAAADGMRQYRRMVRYLVNRAELTRRMIEQTQPKNN
ncbi:hypothetical protein SEA_PUPPERS_53 [Gordonia phage Puppers]|nr:hypothetical protein SEA_PUPPERS_53 [Gordonia phage Puppers]